MIPHDYTTNQKRLLSENGSVKPARKKTSYDPLKTQSTSDHVSYYGPSDVVNDFDVRFAQLLKITC